MKTKIIYLLLMLLSFSNIMANKGSPTEIKYEAEANDIALVVLELKSNGKFSLILHTLDDDKKQTLRGKWTNDKVNYQLIFNRSKQPDLQSLFSNKDNQQHLKIINKHQISITKNTDTVWIWDIYCSRK